MIPPRRADVAHASGIPRESGDDPPLSPSSKAWVMVFPARAGMIPRPQRSPATPSCIPRESGDDPAVRDALGRIPRYSPRERG